MSDVFVSYSYRDRERVRSFVKTLEAAGWSVFWDVTIDPGKTWRQELAEQVIAARAVVVIWSHDSVTSDWVQEEAEEGRRRHILVPIRIDEVTPPFGFGRIHAADFTKWDGTSRAHEFQQVVGRLHEILGPPAPSDTATANDAPVETTADDGLADWQNVGDDMLIEDAPPDAPPPTGAETIEATGRDSVSGPVWIPRRARALLSLAGIVVVASSVYLVQRTRAPNANGGPVANAAPAASTLSTSDPAASISPSAGPASSARSGSVDIDLLDDEPGPPATPGPMTERAAAAKKLFDEDHYSEAAVALMAVVAGETGDDEGNKQLAQYFLGVSLYRLAYFQSSYALFSMIAMTRNHLKFNETLLWLAKLATQLPEAADIVERVGKYSTRELARFNNAQQKELYWQLNYLLARFQMRNRDYVKAIELLGRVDQQSPYFAQAQLVQGIAEIAEKKSVPAIQAFRRVLESKGPSTQTDEYARTRDLALLSLARTYYSGAVQTDSRGSSTSNPTRLGLSLKYSTDIARASEYWEEATLVRTWSFFITGDDAHALECIDALRGSYYPETSLIEASIAFANSEHDRTRALLADFAKKYGPIRAKLETFLASMPADKEDGRLFALLASARTEHASVAPELLGFLRSLTSQRIFKDNFEYVQQLDEEALRFRRDNPSFKRSTLGNQVNDALQLSRDLAIRNIERLGRARLDALLEDVKHQLGEATRMTADL